MDQSLHRYATRWLFGWLEPAGHPVTSVHRRASADGGHAVDCFPCQAVLLTARSLVFWLPSPAGLFRHSPPHAVSDCFPVAQRCAAASSDLRQRSLSTRVGKQNCASPRVDEKRRWVPIRVHRLSDGLAISRCSRDNYHTNERVGLG